MCDVWTYLGYVLGTIGLIAGLLVTGAAVTLGLVHYLERRLR